MAFFNLKQKQTLRLLQVLCFILIAFLISWNLYHWSPVSRNRIRLKLPYSYEETVERKGNSSLGEIDWYPCIPTTENVECGSISCFRKDYLNPEAGYASIALAIYRAKKHPRKGSVFLNPGGPGGPGTHLTLHTGSSFAKLIGDDWDLVGFDPRGTGKTRPETRCFGSNVEYDAFFANTVIEQGITVSSIANLSDPQIYEELVPQYQQFLALKKGQAELCRQNMGDELSFMSTTTVVRDMDYISKVLETADTKINYWGESYGSIIGAYLVNMMPERAWVRCYRCWSNEPTHKWPTNWLANAEKTYEIFLKDCSKAGPSVCPLTQYKDEPWQNIEQRFEAFFDATAKEPIPVLSGHRPGILTSGAARGLLEIYLYNPQRWPEAANVYSAAFAGNATLLYNLLVPPLPSSTLSNQNQPTRDLHRQAISCLDSPPPKSPTDYPTPEDLARIGVHNLQEVSRHFGVSLGVSEADGGCQFWPVTAPERFSGPWGSGVELQRKMVIISNTADPVTPLTSGLLLNSLMPESSTMIIQDGPGHCSNGLPSLCTAKLVQAYFSGTSNSDLIPQNGTVCTVDVSTFPQPDDEADRKWRMMSQEDRALIQALKDIRRGAVGGSGRVDSGG
ncbi:hypothetical protein BT96DRAFT_916850 [Gymnopus androsaceus JB14]|uniref:Alpha/beta-hydrolase n=1 Tax=Gymnopus androsaceus JB14 TaxID=1447944 RepID=A0A6A4I6X7_9AGAR|nr:hypothetical protein BT96DRAFT_916850 [Gymnopus androsaceus JB14]